MPDRICDPMAPKGLYSVQKSRSFGGINRYRDSPPGDSPVPTEQGRRTPNLGSLRKKFSRKKTTSFDDDDGDYADGSSLKKKNKSKVGNLFKWFKKDNSKDQSFESDNLTPKLTRVIQKPSEGPQTISVSPLKHRSCSYDSICSVGSATSSFAFVPVNAYKVGRCVESKKRIAIGLNCGMDTYKARIDHGQNGLDCDKELTLKTKYKLMPSESPPTLKKDENFSAISGPQLPSGPILPSSQLKDENSGSDTDDTVELESISQRGSPVLWPAPTGQPLHVASPDQQKKTADKNAAPSQPIKPRQLSGQLLHPMTIKLNDDSKKNALHEIGNESENGTLKYFEARQFANLDRLVSDPVSGCSATKPESLPNISTAEGQQVLHYPQSSNPFGDTASLAATLPIQKRGDVSSVSPRSSLSGEDFRPLNHIPGKRKAPGPPGERPTSPSTSSDKSVTPKVIRSKDYSNPFVKKKGPAPKPPDENKANSLENGSMLSAGLAPFQASSSRPSSRQSEKIKSVPSSSSRLVMTGSAPVSPLLSKRFISDKPQEQKNEWVFEDGVLKSVRESKQDISASLAEEKEPKEGKAPLSPKPWYKRSIAKDSNDKKNKDKSKDSNKKAKTPENLPEIHTSRESIRVKETFEEKYSYFSRMSKENLSEIPKSPKLFLRNKIMSTSPKAERPNSRPISGLTGISDLDRQAAEIIRRKNEDEAAKRKANDEKFYTDREDGENAQQALDAIMDNVSQKMHCLDKIENHKDKWDKFMDNNLKSDPSIVQNEVSAENERNDLNKSQNRNSLKVSVELKDMNNTKSNSNVKMIKPVNAKPKNGEPVTNCHKKIEIDISPNSPINLNQNDNKNSKNENEKVVKESDIEQDVQSMDNVVSDLNSFLASTRKAMSSPSSQKRLFSLPLLPNSAQVKEANVKRTTSSSPTSNSMPIVKGGGTSNQYKENMTLFSPIIEQSETTSNSSVSSTPIFGAPFFKDQGEKKSNGDYQKVNNVQNRNSNSFAEMTMPEQKFNYFPPSSIPSSEYKSNLPPPPTQAPLPPLAVEKQDGWSCHRCTLINYNAQLWCEACGGKRLFTNVENENLNCQTTSVNNTDARLAINEQDLDNESEDAAPRIGNVLDKLVLFSAIDAKARETPTLQRRRSADINKLSRTYSNAMLPIDENPLQKTLDRISQKQAELAKPKDYFTSNSQRSSPKTVSSECSPQYSSEREKKTSSHIIKEQEKLLEEASANLRKQKQNEEQMELGEKTSTLPLNTLNQTSQLSSQLENVNELGKEKNEVVQISKEKQFPAQEKTLSKQDTFYSDNINKGKKEEDQVLRIVETPKPQDFKISNAKMSPNVEVKRASSFKGSFDFTKTPRAFIASKGAVQAPQWTKYVSDDNKVNTVTAPKLEFLGSEVTRKYSQPDTDQMRRARLDFFTPNDDNHPQNLKPIGNVNTKVIDKLEMGVKKEEHKSLALLEDPTKPNINTIPKQRNSMTNLNKQLNLSRINSVSSLSLKDPYYAHPVSPPRPVTPPRPKSPENFQQITPKPIEITNINQFPKNIPQATQLPPNFTETNQTKQNFAPVNQLPKNIIQNNQSRANFGQNIPKPQENSKQPNKPSQPNCLQTKPESPTMFIPTKQKSPILTKPARPKSPEILSSDDEDTPPPRPASPIFQYPSLPRSKPASNTNVNHLVKENYRKQNNIRTPEQPMQREELKTPVNRKSMTHEKDNLAELVTAHFISRNMNSRSCTPQGPSSGYNSRPFTPQDLVNSQSRSRIPQEIVESQSQSRIPQELIQSQSKSRIPQELTHSQSKSRIPVARNPATPMNNFYRDYRDSHPTTPLLSKQNSFSNFGQFSSSPHRFEDQRNERHSSYIDDSDYGAYQMSRDFVRTPSILDERALSRIGSTSLISENDYSAFTPVAVRKMSVSSVSTPLATPKLNRDFGFVSSKKESMPKPPRRRSKDPGFDSRPQSRQINSSSRETTPVNNPLSPVRPSRMRGKNYQQQRHNKKLNCDNNKLNRPKSLQENSPEPLYEILTPPSNTFHATNMYSSSDSDSDFRTPQASPKVLRPSSKNKNKNARKSSIYEDIEVGQSYENFNDNPVLEKSKKISRMITKQDKDYALPAKICKPKLIPPRASQEPIPTPRKSSLTRSRNQSTESINRMNSLPREVYPKREPYYKVPPSNPKLVNPNDNHFYSEPLYEEDQQIPKDSITNHLTNTQKVSNCNARDKNEKLNSMQESYVSKSAKAATSDEQSKKAPDKLSAKPSRQDMSRRDESRRKSPSIKQDQNIPPNLRSKQKLGKKSGDLESSTNTDADTRVEVELSEADDRFYDTKEEIGEVLIKKSKGIATLPNGSKYPCVIVQRKAKKKSNEEQNKQNKDIKLEEIPQKKAERKVKNYIPTEMPMKPDWFDDLKIKKDENKNPRPTSIIDGVLYTSKALLDVDSKSKKLGTFNLIEPEVFETYDVCKNQTMKEPKRHTIEDVQMQPPLRYPAPDSYENTPAPQVETTNTSYTTSQVYPQHNFDTRQATEFKKTSADNPFRCKSSQSSVQDETEAATSKGVDTFKALLVGQGEGPSGDLLRRLEEAISKGDHKYAASLAKDLAKLKISSRLTEQELDDKKSVLDSQAVKLVKANMFVEDAVSAQGPIVVEVNPAITVADLKLQIEAEFEIPVNVQKWILGKNLVSEDTLTLHSQGIDVDGAEIFLYLVNPAEREAELATAAAAAAEAEMPKAAPPPKIPLVLPTEPFQKGRYWNYEEDRWSFCNSDDDEDRDVEVQQMGQENKVEPAAEAAKAAANEDDEWEYYYEDVDMKAKANAEEPTIDNPEVPKPKTNFQFIAKPAEIPAQNSEPVPGTSGAAAPEPAAPKPVDTKAAGWECPVCTLMNPLERPGCLACTTERPADLGAAAAPAEQPAAVTEEKPKEEKKNNLDAYKQLENLDIIPNAENFECTICYLDTEPGDGVVLRECLHTFCKICLAASIEHSDAPKVKCPFKDDNYSCDMELLEREIKALVSPAVFEKHQKKSVKEAEANIQNTFHCKTPDCAGWTVVEDDVNIFKCPLCKRTNCITCQAIHDGMDCKQYQQYMLVDSQDENSKKTKEWMDDLIGKGEALHCPSCQVLLLKKWGCDWVRCTYCRTEICWVTRQLRWGPNGRGDTSGGCKCMIDGRTKCHKNCNYCH